MWSGKIFRRINPSRPAQTRTVSPIPCLKVILQTAFVGSVSGWSQQCLCPYGLRLIRCPNGHWIGKGETHKSGYRFSLPVFKKGIPVKKNPVSFDHPDSPTFWELTVQPCSAGWNTDPKHTGRKRRTDSFFTYLQRDHGDQHAGSSVSVEIWFMILRPST